MKRLAVCGVLGLILVGGLAFAFQGGSKGSGGDGATDSQASGQESQEPTPCTECGQAKKDRDQFICPLYKYADHGGYCSYYSTLSPGCMPANYDGPCDTITGGNCNKPLVAPACIQRDKPQSKPDHGHFIQVELAKGKKGKPFADFSTVVVEKDSTGAPYKAPPKPVGDPFTVRFKRNKIDGSAKIPAAAVLQAFAVHHKHADPKSQVFVLGTGHEIDPGTAPVDALEVTEVIENGAGPKDVGCDVIVGSVSYQVIAVEP